MTGLLELTGEVAGELGGPAARGMRRDPEQMNAAGPGLDDERDVQTLEREDAVDVEEIRSQQRCGMLWLEMDFCFPVNPHNVLLPSDYTCFYASRVTRVRLNRIDPNTGALISVVGPITDGPGGLPIGIADLTVQPNYTQLENRYDIVLR